MTTTMMNDTPTKTIEKALLDLKIAAESLDTLSNRNEIYNTDLGELLCHAWVDIQYLIGKIKNTSTYYGDIK